MAHKIYRMARGVGKSTDVTKGVLEAETIPDTDLLVRYWRRWLRVRTGLPPDNSMRCLAQRFEARKQTILTESAHHTRRQFEIAAALDVPLELLYPPDVSMGCRVKERCTICGNESCVHLGPFAPAKGTYELSMVQVCPHCSDPACTQNDCFKQRPPVLVGVPPDHGKSFLHQELLHERSPEILIVDHRPPEQQLHRWDDHEDQYLRDPILGPVIDVIESIPFTPDAGDTPKKDD